MDLETLSKATSLVIAVPVMLAVGSLPYFAVKAAGAINRMRNRRRIAAGLSSCYNDIEKFDLDFMRNYIG